MYSKFSEINLVKKRPKLFFGIVITTIVFIITLIIIISSSSSSSITYTNIGIGGGGSFHTPMIDPNDDNILYTTSDMGGLYYSHNRGKSWKRSYKRGVFHATHISSNGTLFLGGFGLYVSFDKGKTLELIHPKNLTFQISRCGWNENVILGDYYHYSFLKTVTSYANKIYFINCNWSNKFLLMESDFSGNNFRVLLEEETTLIPDPVHSLQILSLADESGLYYTMETFINFYNFTDSTIRRIDIPEGTIKDFQKIDGYYFLIVDTTSISKILYTKDFIEYKDLQDYNTLSNEFEKYEQKGTFNWHFIQLSGNKFNSIFLSLRTSANEFNELVEGIIKFNGVEFEWVFSNIIKTLYSLNVTGWTYGTHGPINGVYASKNNPNLCLMSNIETVYLMEYETEETKQIDNLHVDNAGNGYYITRGLDVQTTYWVKEDPFDSNHIIIASTDVGIQISHDNGKTFTRMELTELDYRIHNTCYDLYFDTETKDLIYGIWSSRHDAPYSPSYDDKDTTLGKFAISTDGGVTWNFTYSSGIPNDAIPMKMSVKKTKDALIFAVAAFNRGFYISYDSGKTFTSINDGVERLEGLIFGEDIIIVDDIVYCLTAPMPPTSGNNWLPSKLYKYSMSTNTMEQIDLGEIVIARSITYHAEYGLLISVIPNFHEEWVVEWETWKYVNDHGGIYVYDGKSISKFFENYDGIFNCGVMSNGDIYAVDTYGKIFKYKDKEWKVFYEGLFIMLKNVSFSNNEKILYVTAFGGGTYKFKL